MQAATIKEFQVLCVAQTHIQSKEMNWKSTRQPYDYPLDNGEFNDWHTYQDFITLLRSGLLTHPQDIQTMLDCFYTEKYYQMAIALLPNVMTNIAEEYGIESFRVLGR